MSKANCMSQSYYDIRIKLSSGIAYSAMPLGSCVIHLFIRAMEGSTWHSDEAARCWVRSLLDLKAEL